MLLLLREWSKEKKDGKYVRRRDSTDEFSSDYDEAKAEAPENVVILVESNPTVVDELKTIFSDPNPEITRNTKVRRIMMIKDIEPKIRQQAVMAIMQGKDIWFADEKKLKTKQESKVNICDSEETFLDEIVTEWESDAGLLERSHSSFATWLRENRDGNFDIYDEKTSSTLEEAYAGGPGAVVQVKGPYSEFIIDLEAMKHTNIYSGEILNVVRLPGVNEQKHFETKLQENARDARIVVLVRGASLEEEFEEAIDDEEIASWIYDVGGGNWDIFESGIARTLEHALAHGEEFTDLYIPNLTGDYRVNLVLMSMSKLNGHQGPAVTIRRLGGEIITEEEKAKKKLNTRAKLSSAGETFFEKQHLLQELVHELLSLVTRQRRKVRHRKHYALYAWGQVACQFGLVKRKRNSRATV